ncbi:hypothetical protein [Providencia rettgeri]|uniref:hypothetical protein n=1 Tax=Providencia rettgeri TaxID=587 RepID=UPI0024AA3BA8
MGATFFIGYLSDKSLHTTLNRYASDALEALVEDALQENYPKLYEIITEMIVLDQISFIELNKQEFNEAINVIRAYLKNINNPTEGQIKQKYIWDNEIEPLIQQDKRYEDPNI